MEWWNFSDPAFLATFIVSIFALVIILFFTLSLIINKALSKRFFYRMKAESTTLRVFIINTRENRVLYFNRSNLRSKRNMDISHFYNRFNENDVDKVKSWIYDIAVAHKEVDEYLEAEVNVDHGKNTYFSLLQLLKYDNNTGYIHIQSHVMRYLTPSYSTNRNRNGKLFGVIDKTVAKDLVNTKKSPIGYVYAIRTYYLRPQVATSGRIEKLMDATIKNEIYNFANDYRYSRQIVNLKNNELLLLDLKISDKDDAVRLASSIAHNIDQSIELNGYSDKIAYSIGICSCALYYQDFDSIINGAQQACIYAQQNDKKIYLFSHDGARPAVDYRKFTHQISSLFKPGALRYLFRPIYDVSFGEQLGYFASVRAYDSPFTNFAEMSRYAAKVNKNNELFAVVSKQVITKFINENEVKSNRLFLFCSLVDIEELDNILKQIANININDLVLVYDEEEINDNFVNPTLITAQFVKLKEKGYRIALSLKDKNLLLDPGLYAYFDYYVVGNSMVGEIKRNARSRLSFQTLVEQLLKYHKPIIATDLEGWQAVELIIKSGINIISSESISPSSDMFLPLDKRKIERLTALYNKYK